MFSWDELVQEARKTPVPAPMFRALSLSQWALESNWGASPLAREHGNYACLKFDETLQDLAAPVAYDAGEGQSMYCAFRTPQDFIAAYWRSSHPLLAAVLTGAGAEAGAVTHFMQARGHHMDSAYAERLIAVLPQASRLLLADTASHTQRRAERSRPSRAASGEWIGDHLPASETPVLKKIPSVTHEFQGVRRHGLSGAILRFDDGRTRLRNGMGDEEWGAINTLGWGQRQGLAFVSIARNGAILMPSNFDWHLWGFHAGSGSCPQTGQGCLSEHYIGVEMNGPAQLYPTPDPDCFVPWFNAARDDNGQIRLNIYGEARRISSADEWYKRDEVAIIADRQGSLRPGVYAPATPAQKRSLYIFLIWLKRTFPDTFRFERVFSSSEIIRPHCADSDPGFGLVRAGKDYFPPLSMAAFRDDLTKRWSNQLALMAKSYFQPSQ